MADDGGIITVMQNGVRALFLIATNISKVFPAASGTSTTATGGAIAPPANVVGYLNVTLPNGTAAKVPYYT